MKRVAARLAKTKSSERVLVELLVGPGEADMQLGRTV